MKKIIALLLALVMVFALCACGSSTSSSSPSSSAAEESAVEEAAEAPAAEEAEEAPAAEDAAAEEPTAASNLTIAVSTIAYSIAVLPQVLIDNLQALCEENGWKFNMLAAEGDAVLQGEQVQTLVDQNPDYLIMFPADAALAVDWVKTAYDAGISVILVGTDVAAEGQQYAKAFCGPNNYEMGVELAEALIAANGADAGLGIVEIGGNAGQADYIDRKAGFEATIQAGSNYTFLGDTAWCHSSRTDAQDSMADFISTYGDQINVLYGMDDDLTLGGVNAIAEAGKTDDIQVLSITGQIEAIQAIKDGKMVTTTYTPTLLTASLVIDAINEYAANGSVDYQQSYIPDLITAENADNYEGEF